MLKYKNQRKFNKHSGDEREFHLRFSYDITKWCKDIFHDTTPLYFYILSTKVAHKIFRLSTARVKVPQISHVIFQTKNQFFFKVWIFFHCYEK